VVSQRRDEDFRGPVTSLPTAFAYANCRTYRNAGTVLLSSLWVRQDGSSDRLRQSPRSCSLDSSSDWLPRESVCSWLLWPRFGSAREYLRVKILRVIDGTWSFPMPVDDDCIDTDNEENNVR
jgi:hypothetical protein